MKYQINAFNFNRINVENILSLQYRLSISLVMMLCILSLTFLGYSTLQNVILKGVILKDVILSDVMLMGSHAQMATNSYEHQ